MPDADILIHSGDVAKVPERLDCEQDLYGTEN